MSLNGNSEVPGGTGGGKALGLLKLFLEERQGTPGHHGGVAHPLVIQLHGVHEVPHYLVAVISGFGPIPVHGLIRRSEEHTSELQSLMRISYAVVRLKTQRRKTTERRVTLRTIESNT